MIFRQHPAAIFYMLKSYWYIFTAPVVRIVVAYLLLNIAPQLYLSEIVVLIAVLIFAVLKWLLTKIEICADKIIIKNGFLIKSCKTIYFSALLGIVVKQNLLDFSLGSARCYLNIERGWRGKAIKLRVSVVNARMLCKTVYNCDKLQSLSIERKISRYFTVSGVVAAISIIVLVKDIVFWRKTIYGLAPTTFLILVNAYYMLLCYYNYKNSKIYFGDIVFAQGTKMFSFYMLYCPKNKIQSLKMVQSPINRKHNTCTIKLLSNTKVGERVKIKNVALPDAIKHIKLKANV